MRSKKPLPACRLTQKSPSICNASSSKMPPSKALEADGKTGKRAWRIPLENDDGVQDVVEGEYQGYYCHWVEGLMLLGFDVLEMPLWSQV